MKIKNIILTLFLGVFLATFPQIVFAADRCGEVGGPNPPNHGVDLAFDIGCTGTGEPIPDMLRAGARFLSVGVGLVVVLFIIVSGIQYISSAGNPQGIEAAKGKLTNAIIALLVFIFMFAILQFLIPDGLF